jgi:hypothetical protein
MSERSAENRAYFRVAGALPLRHRRLTAPELEVARMQIQGAASEGGADASAQILARLARIEQQLELLLSRLDASFAPPLGESDLHSLEISGSGMRYAWAEPVAPGEHVLVEFLLPQPVIARRVRAIARVVRCDKATPPLPFSLALAFVEIDEADRDAIVRYALALERRTRHAEPGAEPAEPV